MLHGQQKRADTSSAGTEPGRQMNRNAAWPPVQAPSLGDKSKEVTWETNEHNDQQEWKQDRRQREKGNKADTVTNKKRDKTRDKEREKGDKGGQNDQQEGRQEGNKRRHM